MKRFIATLAIVSMPMVASARSINGFELQCREALKIGSKELQPGPEKGKLRDCVRNLAAEARRPAPTVREQGRQEDRIQQTREHVLEQKQRESEDDVRFDPNTYREQFDKECRDELGLEAEQTPKPGPQLARLLRCTERKIGATRRGMLRIRRRTPVEQRRKEISKRIQQQESNELTEELQKRSTLRRNRLDSQKPISTTEYLNIRQSGRSRTDFSESYTEGSTAQKKRNAVECRYVAAQEWADCIREALSQ